MHFKRNGVNVDKVEKVSHEDAYKKSFVMTVKTREDYNKVLQGDIVPSSVGVRRYIPPKRARESEEGGSFVSKPGKAPPKQT